MQGYSSSCLELYRASHRAVNREKPPARATALRQRKEAEMAKNVTPPNAEFVGRVVSDASNPPETRMLTGWLGDAAEEGYRRLYTNAELSAYVDIPADAILYSEPMRDVQPSG